MWQLIVKLLSYFYLSNILYILSFSYSDCLLFMNNYFLAILIYINIRKKKLIELFIYII